MVPMWLHFTLQLDTDVIIMTSSISKSSKDPEHIIIANLVHGCNFV